MKSTVIKYGVYSAITLGLLFVFGLAIGQNMDYSAREVIGYTTMIMSLLFVFFGIKHFRDKENNGVVSFGKGVLIGVLISLIASVSFGIIDLVYITYINPDFVTEYYNHSVEQLRVSLPKADFQVKLKEMEAQKELFTNPFLSFLLMSLTVFILGFVISLISSLILQRKN